MNFTAVGNVTTEISKNGDAYVALASDKWDGTWTTGTDGNYDVIKITVTSVDGSQSETYYIAYQVATTYTVKVINNNSNSIKVTMGDESKIIANSGNYTFTAKVASGSNFDVSYVVDNNGTATASVTGATTSGAFGGVVTVEGVTGNVEITFA